MVLPSQIRSVAESRRLTRSEARPTGFEPVTFGFVDRRSIQLSYGRLTFAGKDSRTAQRADPARGGTHPGAALL